MNWFKQAVTSIVSPIANVFVKRSENKTKVKLNQIERLKNSDDALAEWESIQAESGNHSWKDEYITLIITLPIPVVFFAVIYSVVTGDPLVAEAAKQGVSAITEILPNYSELVLVVSLAAIGIKAFKRGI